MRYYTCANTSGGLVDFTEENIFDIETKVELKGGSEQMRSLLLELIRKDIREDAEEIMVVGCRDLKSGIILRDKGLAIVEGCENSARSVNLDDYFGKAEQSPEIEHLYQSMIKAYNQAKEIHDEWESIYISNMDFDRLNKFGDNVIESLLEDKTGNGVGKTYKRFFGTSTADGPVNYIDDLTDRLGRRCFIKGRPGTGKSTFLKKLSKELNERKFDVEEYYCSFDKNSLDMVVSRELSFCVFDSTAPHEKFPSRDTDEILDFYTNAGLEGIDEKYENELGDIKNHYDIKINEGMSYFKSADKLKKVSQRQTDGRLSDNALEKIAKSILN